MLYSGGNRDIKARKSPLDNLFENEIRGAVKGWGDGNQGDGQFVQEDVYTQCGYNAKLRLYTQYC
jgi:hypothetical protein